MAEEVRNLAQRCASAAKETETLIKKSVEKAKTGTELAENSGKALTEIVDNFRKVTELVDDIANASSEQAEGVSQLNQAITQMDQVTQANAANAEESSASAETLKTQADGLRDIVKTLQDIVKVRDGRHLYRAEGDTAPNTHRPMEHRRAPRPESAPAGASEASVAAQAPVHANGGNGTRVHTMETG